MRRRGDRQEYFRIAADGWSRMLAARYAKTAAFRQVAERGLAVLSGADPGRRERLANVAELYRFLETELPALWDRWGTAPVLIVIRAGSGARGSGRWPASPPAPAGRA
ncbi:hypothetical protein OUY22_03140 [Nonomuraea sp. MCN248]|uniref:Uncharacterized protein n=1 Tax=Nonomuraea corallina TaxID=2989783 RepID=A0ABT4S5B9_9ACTN|nr:hypothetical protein [Nonomuraea corallina]MDA0632397.1 hypothetical protein [Nonomuraea corallina]